MTKYLSQFNPGKAPESDNLPSSILKELHNEIDSIITNIFITFLAEGVVPDD